MAEKLRLDTAVFQQGFTDSREKAKAIIMEHEEVLHKCAELLLEKEKITREEFEGLFEKKAEPEDFFKDNYSQTNENTEE